MSGIAILDLAHEVCASRNEEAERGPMCRVEHAAQVAELADAHRLHDPLTKSAEYLDGYVDGFERAAELVRMMKGDRG